MPHRPPVPLSQETSEILSQLTQAKCLASRLMTSLATAGQRRSSSHGGGGGGGGGATPTHTPGSGGGDDAGRLVPAER